MLRITFLVTAIVCNYVLILGDSPAQSQGLQTSNGLTVDRIFTNNEFAAEGYSVQWSPDGSKYFTWSSSAEGTGKALISIDALTNTRINIASSSDLTPAGKSPLEVDDFTFSTDDKKLLLFANTKKVWRYNTRGDYWVLDLQSKQIRQVGARLPESSLMFAKLSPSGDSVAYVSQGDLFLESIVDEQADPQKLTNKDHSEVINGTSDWVYEEEFDLKDGFRWSPDGKFIAYWQFDTSGVNEFIMINNTKSMYPQLTRFKYPKAGMKNSAVRIGVVSVADGNTRWIEIPGDPRNNYLARMEFVPDTNLFLVQQLNRDQNTNTLYEVDAETGEFRVLFVDKDDAWLDTNDEIVWFNGNESITWISEKDGWRHLYLIDRKTGEIKPITKGDFDVMETLKILPEEKVVYFIASPENATQRYLYQANLETSLTRRVTPDSQVGWHDYEISADGRVAIHSWSKRDTPATYEVINLPAHNVVRTVTTNAALKSKLVGLANTRTQFFKVNLDDGTSLDGWMILPVGFDASRKYPVIFHVYGEPWGTTVTDKWGGNGYLWHRMLAERGYVVASLDNRGTKVPKGRAWRKSIYKQIGILASSDQAEATRKIVDFYSWIDRDRIGIWGWSGGGSMTLNAMFRYPETYKVGIAVAPVPDMHYYDTIYQERYMSTPQKNPDGYRDGSPINFAKNLAGDLLLIHGTGDDNCHYQTTEKLINELIRLDKQFSMMAYPNRAHGIREGKNTTSHLRKMMTNYFLDKLPAGAR